MRVIPFTIPVRGEKSIILQEDKLPYFYNHLHRHKEIQITWIIKGEGSLLVSGNVHPFKPGMVFLIGANQPHIFKSDSRYFEKPKQGACQSLTVFFDPVSSQEALWSLPEMRKAKQWLEKFPAGCQLNDVAAKKVIEQLTLLKTSKEIQQLTRFLDVISFLSGHSKELQSLSGSNFLPTYTETEGQRLNTIFQYTLQHYSEPIGLSKVATLAHLTVPAFCRYFKNRTRKTFIQFLNEVRINEACKMLQNEQLSISDIAYSTGFSHTSSFIRTFKKLTGKPPHQYRRVQEEA